MNRPLAIASVIVVLVIAFFVVQRANSAGHAASSPPAQQQGVVQSPRVDDVKRLRVAVTGNEPSRGPSAAPVTIVVFSDFECAACAKALTTLSEVEQANPGKVRTVWRNLPLKVHPNARLAAEAALEALAQGGAPTFWAMHNKLYAHPSALTRADLERYAREVDLDLPRFSAALDANQFEKAIKDDMRLAATVGVREPPAIFINGRPFTTAVTREALQPIVDDELTRVEKLTTVDKVSAADVYTTLMRGAQKFGDSVRVKSLQDPTVYNIPVSSRDPQLGPADALVTIVMFGDFEDSYTLQAQPVMDALRAQYGADLRIVWKNTPIPDLHDNAVPAATLAMEAFAEKGGAGFWEAHHLLLDHQSALAVADLERYGKQLGLDPDKLHQAISGDTYKPKLGEDLDLLLRLSPVRTTPLFAINGRFLRGAQAPVIFEAFVDEELAKAREKVRLGTPKAKVYEQTIKAGRTQHAEVRRASEPLQSQSGT
jgi:protein-disulfide isomerase